MRKEVEIIIQLTPGQDFPGGEVVKNPSASVGDTKAMGSNPGSRRSPGEGNGNPLQYSCLENSMDRGAWQATVHAVYKDYKDFATVAVSD